MTDEEKPGLAGLLVLRDYNLDHFTLDHFVKFDHGGHLTRPACL